MKTTCQYADVPPSTTILVADETCERSYVCITNNLCQEKETMYRFQNGFVGTTLYIGNLKYFNQKFLWISNTSLVNFSYFSSPKSLYKIYVENSTIDMGTLQKPIDIVDFTAINSKLSLSSTSTWSPQLSYLKLVNTNITTIPGGLGNLATLVLDSNKLVNITNLPREFPIISLSRNRINQLVNHDWSKVSRLWLAGNPLTTIHNVSFTARLRLIDLTDCPLTNLTFSRESFDAWNTLEPIRSAYSYGELDGVISGFRLNRDIEIDANACDRIGGIVERLWANKTNWSAQACIITSNGVLHTESSSNLVLIIGVTLGIVTVATILFIYFFRKKSPSKKKKPDTSDPPRTNLAPSQSIAPDVSKLRLYKLELTELKKISILSSGAFGDVWLGMYGNGNVAIKKLRDSRPENVEKFIEEIILHSKLNCPYIVRFLGASWRRPIEMECIVEYMDLGDLRNYLKNISLIKYTWKKKLICIESIIKGLVYLHSFQPPILHRDLKSRNILINSKNEIKLTDFGCSRELNNNELTNGIGTFQWMAPEVIYGTKYTLAADIYSFGMILSELCTHEIPYTNLIDPITGEYLSQQTILIRIESGDITPTFYKGPNWIQEWGKQCTKRNPKERPTAIQLLSIIEHAKEAIEKK